MPSNFRLPNRAPDWSRQVDELTVQAQGLAFAIENLLDTDFQSPMSQRKMRTNLSKMHKVLIEIQIKNHSLGGELQGICRIAQESVQQMPHATARPHCRPNRTTNEHQ